MKKFALTIIAILLCAVDIYAATHWVDDNGAAAWNDCDGATPLSGASACSLSTAESNADDDDLVYLRAGTYTEQLSPSNSGSNGSEVEWKAYNSEAVLIAPSSGSALYTTQDYHIFDGLALLPHF